MDLSSRVHNLLHNSAATFGSVPYDFYSPSVQKVVRDRTRKTCYLYFASLLILRKYKATHKQQRVQTRLARPVRAAAHRQRAIMVINVNAENVESAEWQQEGHLDLREQTVTQKDMPAIPFPVYTVNYVRSLILALGRCIELSNSFKRVSLHWPVWHVRYRFSSNKHRECVLFEMSNVTSTFLL